MIRCPACGTENVDLQYACGVCSTPLSQRVSPGWWSSVRAVPLRAWRRTGYVLAVFGVALVFTAIPTNSKWIVLAGLVLVGLAHLILILSYAIQRRA